MVGHAKSLELVTHQQGRCDWNTTFAVIGNGPPDGWAVEDKVSGAYLSQPFTAHVVSISIIKLGWLRLDLHLGEAVDVVTSYGFSGFRSRIQLNGQATGTQTFKSTYGDREVWFLICKRLLSRLKPMAGLSRRADIHAFRSECPLSEEWA